jgi:hypothetical protein
MRRGDVSRAVRRGELPAGEPDRQQVLDLAEQSVRRRWEAWLQAVPAVRVLVLAAHQPDHVGRAISAVGSAANMGLIATTLRQVRGARRVLAAERTTS